MNAENEMEIRKKIAKKLVEQAEIVRAKPRATIDYAGDHEEANLLLDDLEYRPSAYVIGVLVDLQTKAERAWRIPWEVNRHFGTVDPRELVQLSQKTLTDFFVRNRLHRFNSKMGKKVYDAMHLLVRDYDGDAGAIWRGKPSSATVVYRFLQFDGVGQKLASMAANQLARDFKIPFSDYYSIDISIDTHVRRVFKRLGLVDEGAANEQIVFCARSMHPEYPGLLDYGTFRLGRKLCRPTSPKCGECYLSDYCLYAKSCA